MSEKTYKIRRFHMNSESEVIKEGLTFEKAQEWCRDPETNSKTCKTKMAIEYTKKHGPWFDGYEEE